MAHQRKRPAEASLYFEWKMFSSRQPHIPRASSLAALRDAVLNSARHTLAALQLHAGIRVGSLGGLRTQLNDLGLERAHFANQSIDSAVAAPVLAPVDPLVFAVLLRRQDTL